MKISTVAHRGVICCSNSDNLDQVARVMWERDIGCVPIRRKNWVKHMLDDPRICNEGDTSQQAHPSHGKSGQGKSVGKTKGLVTQKIERQVKSIMNFSLVVCGL